MKIALGVFIGILICCVLFIVLAPNSVHEVIDRIHGNSSSNSESSVVPGNDSEEDLIPSDEKTDTVSESSVETVGNPEEGVGHITIKSQRWQDTVERIESTGDTTGAPLPSEAEKGVGPSPEPRTKDEMLDWLKVHNYTVAEEQEFYRIYWKNLKPVSSKPTAIVIRRDGTVVPQYGNTMIANNGEVSTAYGTATVTNNEMTTSASTKYENGFWSIETIRSFVWDPRWDNINDVWSKAKKIKEMDDEN